MIHRVAALALCCAIAVAGMPSLADAPHVRPGDTFTYDVTLQVTERSSSARAPASRARTDSSAGAGTATLTIVTVAPDGTASANLNLDLLGFSSGQPIVVHKTVAATVAPNGEIRPAASLDPLIDQAILLADQSIRDLAGHDVRAQPTWQWRLTAATYPMTIAFDRSLRAEQVYQGLPTLVVQTVGSGDYATQTDPVQASLSIAGTYYYDQRDGLFVGQAIRTDSTVSDATSGSAVASSALVTIVLRSITQGGPPEATPPASAPASATPEPQPTPTAVPTELSPSPYPTVAPVTPQPQA